MTKKATKLLEQMRNARQNWKRNDVDSLYLGYGFIIDVKGKRHDKVYHPHYPQLVTFIPRHTKLGEYVINDAVKLVDMLISLENEKGVTHE